MRLLLIGNVPVDLMLTVVHLPHPVEDVLATRSEAVPGGSFHVLRAAAEGGLAGCYAGGHGTGPYGDLVRSELSRIGVELLRPPLRDRDTGVVVVLVDSTGERAFVTAPDAVVPIEGHTLRAIEVDRSDLVYVSGYTLALGSASERVATWVGELPAGVQVFCDLGPRAPVVPAEVLSEVVARADWVACNEAEARSLTGAATTPDALAALHRRTPRGSILIRAGAAGCWLAPADGEPVLVPAAPVAAAVLDTTGAGDTHSGAFLAALAQGAAAEEAVAAANVAAARWVGRETVGR